MRFHNFVILVVALVPAPGFAPTAAGNPPGAARATERPVICSLPGYTKRSKLCAAPQILTDPLVFSGTPSQPTTLTGEGAGADGLSTTSGTLERYFLAGARTNTSPYVARSIEVMDNSTGPASSFMSHTAQSATYGLNLAMQRPSWNTSGLVGEMDGMSISLRQSNGDSSAILTNVVSRNGYGETLESITGSAGNDGKILKSISTQLGVVDSRDNHEFGLNLQALSGAKMTSAIRLGSAVGASWRNFIDFTSATTLLSYIDGATATWHGPVEASNFSNNGTAEIIANGGSTMMVDTAALSGPGLYQSSAGSPFKYRPVVGYVMGDHQRAQILEQFDSSQDASKMETGLVVNAYSATGFAASYVNNTPYALNTYLDSNGNLYKVTTAGTSASTGLGPTGAAGPYTNGTATFTYVSSDIANGKQAADFFHVAAPGSGHVWGIATDLLLASGWNGGFATSAEFDMSNNSGADCLSCQTVLITGKPGANKIGVGLSIYNGSTINFAYATGLEISGAKLASSNDILLNTSAPLGIYDTGTRLSGIQLSGTYSSGYELGGTGAVQGTLFRSGGSVPNLGGTCTAGAQTGGASAGWLNLTLACPDGTVSLTFSLSVPSGYGCRMWDETTPKAIFAQTGHSVNSATFTESGATAMSNDVVGYMCIGS